MARVELPVQVRGLPYRIYEARLTKQLAGKQHPRHVAVMCDGNRRWARENGFADVSHGHRVGAVKIAELVGWCQAEGIEMVTVYLLSTENLQRDPDELETLFEVITDVVEELSAPEQNWSVRVVGSLDGFPELIAKRIRTAAERTEDRNGVHVNVAIGYGGRQEITDAVRSLVRQEIAAGETGEDLVQSITVNAIGQHLYTSGQPDPDLVIRTSGEQRLSGFLLWQSAYSEIWFTEAYWPEFRRVDFLRALRDYAARHRRFGI
ncbi:MULTISPECIES: isoprenyl transferase [Nocardia]|uniref:Isoprenyl transferase n=2 Tax=Nocardia TaxID=1817 RepID=K0EZ32_NOCB7|nr:MULTISPECIES: isoprenyl transferase [Nocardia]AFU05218.1 Undecaprenyl pyrophosphate synthetase 1 (UPP synthetase 1) (Di-trans,poly-cis-decaprenylcistransferase 1) (Undecaprenyl diphosphate synthase 1) (UDS 1) [Nocardia brasiliensis ATCC 700358]ASF11765.1 isoprenyl transferase [Nocardia brasiliensis]KIA65761.1 farnesyl-diphosphate synthase [Nocardia vulneris]GAJ84541.1 putative short-chain Z-isoprenyl diphosphate synthase [Nocardia brasiliensis NBRC 14402]